MVRNIENDKEYRDGRDRREADQDGRAGSLDSDESNYCFGKEESRAADRKHNQAKVLPGHW
jgi:hypothetical protein